MGDAVAHRRRGEWGGRQLTFGLEHCTVVTMQAVSGAGYPGVPSMDILDNVVPYISGEEDKLETEPCKILGERVPDRDIAAFASLPLSIHAACNRVPVVDGHTESVFVRLATPATLEQVRASLATYVSEPQHLGLPSAPKEWCGCAGGGGRSLPVL